jgi:hypothetical protein
MLIFTEVAKRVEQNLMLVSGHWSESPQNRLLASINDDMSPFRLLLSQYSLSCVVPSQRRPSILSHHKDPSLPNSGDLLVNLYSYNPIIREDNSSWRDVRSCCATTTPDGRPTWTCVRGEGEPRFDHGNAPLPARLTQID